MLNVIEFGMDAQQAVSAPRFSATSDGGIFSHILCARMAKKGVRPNPEPVLVAKVTVLRSKHSATTARQRHAQLAAARIRADPRLV